VTFFRLPAAACVAHLGGPGERHLVHVRVGGQRRAGVAEAGDDVEHARRQPRLHRQLTEQQRRERRLLGRLEDDRAPRRERWGHLPRGHQQREVPRNDLRGHPDRLPQGEPEVGVRVVRRDRQRAALDLGGPARHVVEHVGRQRHVGRLGHRERLPVVQRLEECELLEVLQDQVTELVNHPAAPPVGHLAPWRTVLERGAYCTHGPGGILRLAVRHRGKYLLGGRVDAVERGARRRVDPFAIDQHLAAERSHDILDAGCLERQGHHRPPRWNQTGRHRHDPESAMEPPHLRNVDRNEPA
jgi:hypothetical protein